MLDDKAKLNSHLPIFVEQGCPSWRQTLGGCLSKGIVNVPRFGHSFNAEVILEPKT